MAVLGIVMLLKPSVPFGPVITKDTVVVLEGWYDVIMALDIWELVTFPPSERSTVVPLSIVAGTVVVDGVCVEEVVGVGIVVGVGVEVGDEVGELPKA